ncbi:HMG-Y-related protein A [Linum grandiflorum]
MGAEEANIYTEMILSAISDLGEKDGSNKTSISSYIEQNYTHLPGPVSHKCFLSHYLNRMKDSGKLVFSKSRYSIPGPDGPPPKRRRGRPPKPKAPPATTAGTGKAEVSGQN